MPSGAGGCAATLQRPGGEHHRPEHQRALSGGAAAEHAAVRGRSSAGLLPSGSGWGRERRCRWRCRLRQLKMGGASVGEAELQLFSQHLPSLESWTLTDANLGRTAQARSALPPHTATAAPAAPSAAAGQLLTAAGAAGGRAAGAPGGAGAVAARLPQRPDRRPLPSAARAQPAQQRGHAAGRHGARPDGAGPERRAEAGRQQPARRPHAAHRPAAPGPLPEHAAVRRHAARGALQHAHTAVPACCPPAGADAPARPRTRRPASTWGSSAGCPRPAASG